ncbi:Cell division cycle protein 27 [Liparis tanakae]|uniref:Cell division cycle protein 27 homolog n=2 Tax=Cottioidei TaxID=8100 RepID=A0A4Z2EIU7_9TELE|nr:Cell division cycle protein 27 [Liparis tanakae]
MIYYKQEKFNLAEIHFKKALSINPQSSVLLCHIGVVQHALKKSDAALETLNRAIVIDPKNPLCKFHRASILFANDKYKAALQELEELKQIVPKESLVYFLIGKVYKKLGQTHLALMNFSWAMDLDPKGANNQIKEAIDKRYLPEDEAAEVDDSQDSSIMTDADDTQLHTAESDDVL